MADFTPRESEQIERANSSGKTPVVFIHGLWVLAGSWDAWGEYFDQNGYSPVAPIWPGDPETVAEARENPDALADNSLGRIVDHAAEVIAALDRKPAVMGHSTGGLMVQLIADRGISAVTVAIDPGPFRGVLPLPLSALKSGSPVLLNPLNRTKAVTLTPEQFKYGWANALDDAETKRVYDEFHVAAPGRPLFQMAMANINPWTEAKLDPANPDRGPLLIIDGEKDHTVPIAIAEASYKKQMKNPAVTEFKVIPNRGHSLTVDSGWPEVAAAALEFIKRFT
jgi:pimeloyl-ACP methyl ester carboxylesterase